MTNKKKTRKHCPKRRIDAAPSLGNVACRIIFTWLMVCLVLIPTGFRPAEAGESEQQTVLSEKTDLEESFCSQEMKVPDALTAGLDHLLALVGPDSQSTFDPALIADVLNFTLSEKAADTCYELDKKDDATTVLYEFDIRSDLNHLLKLAFNSEIPAFAATPSSIRLAHWMDVANGRPALPKFWTHLPNPEPPVIARAVEHSENTPDIHTGTYHAYDTDRTFILFRHNDQNIFISLSKQKKTSGVGKKGLVLGPDDDWNYFYSGQKGVNKKGLGWVSSYMYDSFSIAIYVERGNGSPQIRCSVFKGLRAGWAKMNFVKKTHILNGLKRYEKDLRAVIESGSLPDADDLIRSFSAINRLPSGELKGMMARYLSVMARRYGDVEVVSGTRFSDFIQTDDYIEQMNEEEMRAVLVLEYMKSLLGKEQMINIGRLFPNKISKK